MDFTSTIAAKDISNVTTTAPPPVVGLYDPLWAIVLRWTIGGIIVLVGKLIKVNKLAFLAFCRIVSEKVLKFRKLPTVSLRRVLCSSKKNRLVPHPKMYRSRNNMQIFVWGLIRSKQSKLYEFQFRVGTMVGTMVAHKKSFPVYRSNGVLGRINKL